MGSRSAALVEEGPCIALDLSNRKISDENDLFMINAVTPFKAKTKPANSDLFLEDSKDITPVKNPIPLKRRSLMREMDWEIQTEESKATKHPMEMRSRRCRMPKKDYCNPEEYDDYADDLRFLFDDDLPELVYRPRRKTRKRRPHLINKKEITKSSPTDIFSTSNLEENDANDNSTSISCDIFCKIRPNLEISQNSDFASSLCENTVTEASETVQTSPEIDEIPEVDLTNDFGRSDRLQKRKNSMSLGSLDSKRRRKGDSLDRSTNPPKFGAKHPHGEKDLKLQSCLGGNADLEPKVNLIRIPDTNGITVTKMSLRRRHSTPTLGVSTNTFDKTKKMPPRTVSVSVEITKLNIDHAKEGKSLKIAREDSACDCVDMDEFVDSPDSGFSSESSCSAGTPDVETSQALNIPKPDNSKHSLSRMSSSDSGVLADIKQGRRLNLWGDTTEEEERLEREAKQKQEEEEQRIKYQCKWVDCPNPFENRSSAELHSHLEKYHAENYCCKWEGCKVFGKVSRKLSFLQRHIGEHSGEKPYKCILDGCDATLPSLQSLKRHVEAHYSEVPYPKARVQGENTSFPRHILNSRRIKDKRKTLANRHDCMDNRTMGFIKSALIQNEVAIATEESDEIGRLGFVDFHAEIMGERSSANGQRYVLVRWKPENMLPDEWILKSKMVKEKEVRKSDLPENARKFIKSFFVFAQENRNRKTSRVRPSILDSLF